MSLVNCKACGKEIAKGVKKCVHCGKDQRNWAMRHKFLSFIGAVITIGAISGALGGGGGESTSTSTTTTTTSATAKQEQKVETVFKVGETFKIKDMEYTITEVKEQDRVGNEYIEKIASNGGILVSVVYNVKNVGAKPVNPFSIGQAHLLDENGTEYDADIDATSTYATVSEIDNSKFVSDLNPNIQVTDVQVFEISKESYATGKWFVKIGDAKVQIK